MEYCDTLHPSGYRLLFSDELIKPGTDSFLLADFARPKRGMQVCDLGAGIGLLGLLLLNRCPELTVHSVELQPAAAAMLRRNIDANGLQTRMMLHEADLRALRELVTYGLKGLAAYCHHAAVLGRDDPELDAFLERALAATLDGAAAAEQPEAGEEPEATGQPETVEEPESTEPRELF